jgi:hypothetical protein
MTLHLRNGEASDANAVGDICYRAFKAIAEQHNFTPDLPGADLAAAMLGSWIGHEGFFVSVAYTATTAVANSGTQTPRARPASSNAPAASRATPRPLLSSAMR